MTESQQRVFDNLLSLAPENNHSAIFWQGYDDQACDGPDRDVPSGPGGLRKAAYEAGREHQRRGGLKAVGVPLKTTDSLHVGERMMANFAERRQPFEAVVERIDSPWTLFVEPGGFCGVSTVQRA